MLVFCKENLVYFATPKTGSSAIEHALANRADMCFLSPPRLKHTTPRTFVKRYREQIFNNRSTVETVAVMREPIEWLGSWYRYRQREELTGKPQSTRHVSFDKFVNDYLSDERPAYAALGSQFNFLTDPNGKLMVDHVFDYARLNQLMAFLSARLGPLPDLTARNVSERADLSLSEESEARLRVERMKDFALYERVRDAAKSRDN